MSKNSKNNFLLVDLNEKKTKKLAETITSATSRKILNHLTEKDDTEANIAKELSIPISTVHYHLQKLMQAKLVLVDEFHYSPKGREVNHYKLANKYIIIAPRKVSGLKEKLKGILPVGLIVLGIGAVIKFVEVFTSRIGVFESKSMGASIPLRESITTTAADKAAQESVFAAEPVARGCLQTCTPDLTVWFLIGAVVTIIIYLSIALLKERWKK